MDTIPPGPEVHGISSSPQWRMVDARAFVCEGKILLVEVEDLPRQKYIAISYTWSQDMKNWRERMISNATNIENYEQKIALGSLHVSTSSANGMNEQDEETRSILRAHLFFTTVALVVLTRGTPYFWMDIVCIDQDSVAEKEYFVPKMGFLYGNAVETHAYLTGSQITPSISCDGIYFPIWETRAWTVQEFLLATKVLLCYVFEGDVVEDLKATLQRASEESSVVEIGSGMIDRYRYHQINPGYCLAFDKREMGTTCFIEPQSVLGGNLPLDLFLENEISKKGDWTNLKKATTRGNLGKTLFMLKDKAFSREILMRMSLLLQATRISTIPEDMVYSLLAVLGLQDYTVRYGVGFEEARLGVFEALAPDTLKYILGTDWGCNSSSDKKDSALPRILGSEPTIGIELLEATSSPKFTRNTGTRIFSRVERFRLWSDNSRSQSRSLGSKPHWGTAQE